VGDLFILFVFSLPVLVLTALSVLKAGTQIIQRNYTADLPGNANYGKQ